MRALAASSGDETRKPVSPSTICSGIPPTSPAIVGRPFHSASVTVRPKPSRIDFCMHDVGLRLEGVDLDRADVVEVVEDLDVGVAVGVARRSAWKNSQPSGSSVAIEPTSASWTSGISSVTIR